MCSPQQTANEYTDLLKIWKDSIKPELFDIALSKAPQSWRAIYFTNIFDRFCHFIVAEMQNMGLSKQYPSLPLPSTKTERQRQFQDYLENVLPPEPDDFRKEQFEFGRKFLERSANFPADSPFPDDPTEADVRQFFLNIHAVSRGMYSSQRISAVKSASLKELSDILKCFANTTAPIHGRIKKTLTDPPNGVKITSLGPACMAEIPGWLLRTRKSDYPIVNGKFVKTLNHLGLYDSNDTCFPGSYG